MCYCTVKFSYSNFEERDNQLLSPRIFLVEFTPGNNQLAGWARGLRCRVGLSCWRRRSRDLEMLIPQTLMEFNFGQPSATANRPVSVTCRQHHRLMHCNQLIQASRITEVGSVGEKPSSLWTYQTSIRKLLNMESFVFKTIDSQSKLWFNWRITLLWT